MHICSSSEAPLWTVGRRLGPSLELDVLGGSAVLHDRQCRGDGELVASIGVLVLTTGLILIASSTQENRDRDRSSLKVARHVLSGCSSCTFLATGSRDGRYGVQDPG